MKSIKNHSVRTNIIKKETSTTSPTQPCNKCKTCKIINTDPHIENVYNGASLKITCGGNCRTKNIVYVARCKIHNLLYIGHSGEELRERFNKHRYDAQKRPENNELPRISFSPAARGVNFDILGGNFLLISCDILMFGASGKCCLQV